MIDILTIINLLKYETLYYEHFLKILQALFYRQYKLVVTLIPSMSL